MSSHLSEEQIERYRRRAMLPAELPYADDHLAVCEDCRNRLTEGEEEKLQAAFTYLQADLRAVAKAAPAHLLYEQLEAYVDGKLDDVDREIAESHLELCRQCKLELDDLYAFKATIADRPAKEHAPSAQPTFWKKFLSFWHRPINWVPLQVASMAVVVAVAVVSFWVVKQIGGLREQLSELQQIDYALQKQVSTVTDLQEQLAQLQQEAKGTQSGSTPQLVAALYDGDRLVTLDKQGNLAGLESLPPSYQQTVRAMLMAQRIERSPALAELSGKTDRLLGGSAENAPFALLSPSGTAVQTDRPTFRWSPMSGATNYTVGIYDAKFNEVTNSGSVSAPEWTVSRSLERGRLYYWQVTAFKGSDKVAAPAGKFKVLEQAKADELEQARQTYAGSHLVLGTLYAQAGLLDDAEREFRSLLEANPKSSAAQKLLRSVQKR